MKQVFVCLLLPIALFSQKFSRTEIISWNRQAKDVTVIRDHWGIPHVYGNTDADAVFGLMYAQCEDDFNRVEMNYIEKLGRMAEVRGEGELYNDLLIRLVIDSSDAVKDYYASPSWLRKLLDAYAAGINYYLYKHPQTKPLLLKRFKPWYPLLWTDGSIGAINVSTVTTTELKNFYSGSTDQVYSSPLAEPLHTGSNGFALAPSKTASGNAILYINPHVSFYFRPEVQISSNEGLNAYGAVTWGQFFIYQGFNDHCGWMHTSSYTDVADLYAEKVVHKQKKWYYLYNHGLRSVEEKKITLHYLLADKSLRTKIITAYFTHHGPIMARRNGEWISVRANNRSMKGLIQSWGRIKCTNFEEYKKNMQLLSNTSNNTVYADDKGNIAYWHGNFIPRRDPKYDWKNPVDGTLKATEWKGLHSLDEIVHVFNPATGWIQNCNSTPFTVSGVSSPRRDNYPSYMAPDGENFRGLNAAKLLSQGESFTLDKVIAAGYNSHLSAFDVLLPPLIKAFGEFGSESDYQELAQPLKILKDWNRDATENSIGTTLAVHWGEKIMPMLLNAESQNESFDFVEKTKDFATRAEGRALLGALSEVVKDLTSRFGKWQLPWGDINRYQRISGKIQEIHDDQETSLPDGFASSTWGCIPSFASKVYPGTNKRYGYNGNSFICAVEFGKQIKAKSLLTGGESGDVLSPHFSDQASMYTKGIFKEVLFYKDDVLKNLEKKYHPGD